EKAVVLGKLMADTVTIVKPETILKWHRRLVAKRFSRARGTCGQPPISPEVEALVVRMARDNPAWGYDRIAGAIRNLGHRISDQTVANILVRHGLPPNGERRRQTTWAEFLRRHRAVFWACDFFTSEWNGVLQGAFGTAGVSGCEGRTSSGGRIAKTSASGAFSMRLRPSSLISSASSGDSARQPPGNIRM
ncbi:helix-turn-helix domain-containing protein, partial [bacterium]|nr:helix-turn-helix domain-containing protein [bacterium]